MTNINPVVSNKNSTRQCEASVTVAAATVCRTNHRELAHLHCKDPGSKFIFSSQISLWWKFSNGENQWGFTTTHYY